MPFLLVVYLRFIEISRSQGLIKNASTTENKKTSSRITPVMILIKTCAIKICISYQNFEGNTSYFKAMSLNFVENNYKKQLKITKQTCFRCLETYH